MNTIAPLLLVILLSPVSVQAHLLLTAKDGSVSLDPSRFPAAMKPGVEVINKKCDSCHDITRIIKPLETGQAADGSSFTKAEVKEYVIKKMRRPGVILSQHEARDVIRVMEYIQAEAPESDRRPPLMREGRPGVNRR